MRPRYRIAAGDYGRRMQRQSSRAAWRRFIKRFAKLVPGLASAGMIAVMLLALLYTLAAAPGSGPDVRGVSDSTSFTLSATTTPGDHGAAGPYLQSGRPAGRSLEVRP